MNRDNENQAAAREQAVDARGDTPQQGLEMLRRLYETGFDRDIEAFSVALGRPREEIDELIRGTEMPDDDIIMKARGIATERNIKID